MSILDGAVITMPFTQRKRNYLQRVLEICVLACLCLSSMAQEYITKVQHWGVEEGLSHREVNALFQDSRGFIWIGTPFGLDRFDGQSFYQRGWDDAGLDIGSVHQIAEDDKGSLWLFPEYQLNNAYDDINILNPITGIIKSFNLELSQSMGIHASEVGLKVLNLVEGGLVLSSGKDASIVVVSNEDEYVKHSIEGANLLWLVTTSPNQTIWCIIDELILAEVDTAGVIIQSYRHEGVVSANISYLPDKTDFFIYFIKDEEGRKTFYRIDTKSGQREVIDGNLYDAASWSDSENFPSVINSNDKKGWQVLHYRWIYGESDRLLHDLGPSLLEHRIDYRKFMIDRQGRMWYGGNFGINILDVQKNSFKNALSKEDLNRTQEHALRGIAQCGSYIYVNGEYSGTFRRLIDDSKWSQMSDTDGQRHLLMCHCDSDNNIWIGENDQVVSYDIDFNRTQHIDLPGKPWSMYQDSFETIFIGTDNGLVMYDMASKESSLFSRVNRFIDFGEEPIYHIEQGQPDMYWAATGNGLYQLNKENGIVARYHANESGEFFLPARDFQHFHVDNEGILWLATRGSGIIRFDAANRTYRHFTRRDGLSHNVFYAIYADDNGYLWFPSDYGLNRMHKSSGEISSFTVNDGLVHNEFNRISHHQGEDGKLYLGTIDGLSMVDPSDFNQKTQEFDPPLVITRCQRYDRKEKAMEDLTSEVLKKQRLELQPRHDFFQIDFALLDFLESEQVNYSYIIEGFQEEWVDLPIGQLRVNNLPYGDYKLKIRGQNAKGNWSDNELSIELVVLKPFFLNAWFLVISGLILLITGPVFYRIRTYRLRRQKEKLEAEVAQRTDVIRKQNQKLNEQAEKLLALDQMKSDFFTNIAHELRTPLSLILGPIGHILKNGDLNSSNLTLLSKASASGKNLLGLINEILDLRKLEMGQLRLNDSSFEINQFIESCYAQFETHARLQEISFTKSSSLDIPLYIVADREKLQRIVYNYLSNAMKFTQPGGKVTMDVGWDDSGLLISVSDTGEGIPEMDLSKVFDRYFQSSSEGSIIHSGTGIGLSIVKEYAELMRGRAWVISKQGEGSTFYVSLACQEVSENHTGKSQTHTSSQVENVNFDSDDQRPEAALIEEPQALAVVQNQAKIMVVEDNPVLREYLTEVLEEEGFKVIPAVNGKLAWKMLEDEHAPDLILSDIMMPVMDGFQLLELIKNHDHTRHLPIIMLTARTEAQDKLRALRIGVDDYLVKPFDNEELLTRIKNLLGNYRSRTLLLSKDISEGDLGPQTSKAEAKWLEEVELQANQGIAKGILSVQWLAHVTNLSERQLRRRLSKITGLSPQKYITQIRLEKARTFILGGEYMTISEVAYEVGFKNTSAFARSFKNRFGKTPTEIIAERGG